MTQQLFNDLCDVFVALHRPVLSVQLLPSVGLCCLSPVQQGALPTRDAPWKTPPKIATSDFRVPESAS